MRRGAPIDAREVPLPARRSPSATLVAAFVLLAAFAAPVGAAAVRAWTASTEGEFAAGTLEGTAVDDLGRVRLAPQAASWWGPEAGVVWAVEPAGRDAAWVALSGPGRLIRVVPGAEAETWLDAGDDVLVTALAAGGRKGLLAAIAPEGRIVRLDRPTSEPATFAQTGASFVWALVRSTDGAIWAGTGLPGRLLRFDADGQERQRVEFGEDPVRSILPLDEGGVIVGTGGRGRVVRVDRDGRRFVLLDADEAEIVALAEGPDGSIFAVATRGPKQPAPRASAPVASDLGAATVVRVVATPPEGEGPGGDERPPPAPTPPAGEPTRRGLQSIPGGVVYRIDRDGAVRPIWRNDQEMPLAAVGLAGGGLLIGTGDRGRLWELDAEGRATRLLRVGSDQPSALALDERGGVLVGASADARLIRLDAAVRESGSWLSPAIDAGTSAMWGRLRWEIDRPEGARVRVEVRAGNTAEPEDTWTDWVDAVDGGEAEAPELPAARWFQCRITLERGAGGSPVLRRVEIAYQARNRPPVVEAVGVEAPGVVWIRGPAQGAPPVGPLVVDDPVSRRVAATLRRASPGASPIRKAYEVGGRTFSWKVNDPDDDRIRVALSVRREGESAWIPLVSELEDEFFSWDARGVPDGIYRSRLVADDGLDNPNGTARESERTSEAFVIDNTRPGVERLEVSGGREEWIVHFEAVDPGGHVAAIEFAIDDEGWRPLTPEDGVADGERERARLRVARGGRAERVLVIRVVDGAGNVAGAVRRLDLR